jgi:LPXTG-motif cell wall-anchored protein
MYEGPVLSAATPVVATAATAVVLPNTGVSSNIVTLAVAVLAGLVTWGVMYAHTNR